MAEDKFCVIYSLERIKIKMITYFFYVFQALVLFVQLELSKNLLVISVKTTISS